MKTGKQSGKYGGGLPLYAKLLLNVLAFCGFLQVCAASGAELGKWDFASGAQGWTPAGQATVSDTARRAGTKSLKISQQKDEEKDSAWLSPVIKSDGKAVKVCLWAADNYTKQPDYSYSAAIALAPCNPDGSAGVVNTWEQMPWDDSRHEQWWGPLTPAGLVWKYYEFKMSPPSKEFRVKFFWPKGIVRGECLIGDVRVIDATSEQAAGDEKKQQVEADKKELPCKLETTTAANCNLFYSDDPLKFEFLLFPADGKELPKLANPEIIYTITDYEQFSIASGKIPFAQAKPYTFAKENKSRTNNLHLSYVIPDAAAKEPGREFFLNAVLKDGDKVIADDTITYGVVNPREISTKDIGKCLFAHFTGEDKDGVNNTDSKRPLQSVRAKMGISYIHDWDYAGWKKAQPVYPGPFKFEEKPSVPQVIYCPNLEQIRSRKPNHPWGHVGSMAPEGALLDDPFHPGCKTFNIDAYVEYIVARVKAHRNSIAMVVASGLERNVDARTIELQKKAYTALKKEFPDLPVGIMLYGLFMNPSSQAKIFMDEKLYEYADFVDDHMYQPSMDWTEWDRVRKEVKAKGKDLYFISTEFSRVGGNDQVDRCRDMVTSHIEAWSHGMRLITYFNVPTSPLQTPLLRGGVGDGFQWMQNVQRPQISGAIQAGKHKANSNMPMLQALTYYNLVQNFECADFKTSFKPGRNSIAYVFTRDGKTICAVYQTKPARPEILKVSTNVPFTSQDLFGRTTRIEPAGAALITATAHPTILTFDQEIAMLNDAAGALSVIKELENEMDTPVLPRGARAKLKFQIPAAFPNAFTAEVTGTVDGTWPETKAQTVKFEPGKAAEIELPVSIDAARQPGSYTFTVSIRDGKRLVGSLKMPLCVSDLISIDMTGVTMTPSRKPAVEVTLHNLSDSEKKGEISLENIYFGVTAEPMQMRNDYTIPANGKTTVRFYVPPECVNMATSYIMTAKLSDKSGIKLTKQDEVSFRSSQKTEKPLFIDGDASDWKLEELCAIPFERYHASWGKKTESPKDLDAKMYTRWDKDYLYFLVIVNDDSSVVRANTVEIWPDDNIMLGIYPWGWKLGTPLNSGYYREHLGPCLDEQARAFRVGNPPGGQTDTDGVKIAVKRTDSGYVYEWAYPMKSLAPLEFRQGSRFRISLAVCDKDKGTDGKLSNLGAIQLGGFNLSIDAQPSKWREFVLEEK